MKEDLRMNAKSPDPDDLSGELPQTDAWESSGETDPQATRAARQLPPDRSAPHIPPLEKGRIKSDE